MPRTVAWVLKHPRAIWKVGRGQWDSPGDKWEKDFRSIRKEKSQRTTALGTQSHHKTERSWFPKRLGFVESGGVRWAGMWTGDRQQEGQRGKKPVPLLYSIHPIPMVTLIFFATPYTFKIKSPCGAGSGWVSEGGRKEEHPEFVPCSTSSMGPKLVDIILFTNLECM